MTACKSYVQFQINGPGVNLSTTLRTATRTYWLYTATFQPSGDLRRVRPESAVSRSAGLHDDGVGIGHCLGTLVERLDQHLREGDFLDRHRRLGRRFRSAAPWTRSSFKAGKLALTRNGKAVSSLKSGR